MTTYSIYLAQPAAGGSSVGYATPVDSGLRLDATVTGTGTNKSILDDITGSTEALKVAKLLHGIFQKNDRSGRAWMATSDGGTTFIKPTE